jgi:hypothetical protein
MGIMGTVDRNPQFFGQAPVWAQEMFKALRRDIHSVERQLDNIWHGEGFIMGAVQVEQGDIDTVASTLEALVAVIATIKPNLPPADETALTQAVTDVTNAVNAVAPTPPAPPVTPPATP